MFYYDDFLRDRDGLDFETCGSYYQELLAALKPTDKEGLAYWHAFVLAAVHYTQIRGEWLLLSREERQAKDEVRTTRHNKVIYSLKLYIAYRRQEGQEFPWFEKIQDNRKQIGDLACYVSYVYALNGR